MTTQKPIIVKMEHYKIFDFTFEIIENDMDILKKIETLENLKYELQYVRSLQQMVDKPNLKMSWGDNKNEVIFINGKDRILQPLFAEMERIAESTIFEIEEEIKTFLK